MCELDSMSPVDEACRRVVERTHPPPAELNRLRRLLIRWEKKVENYLAMLHFACAWITLRVKRPVPVHCI